MSELLCNNCINSRLAQLKHQREQQERQNRIRAEQEALIHSQRIAELESKAISEHRLQMRQETESYSRELEKRYQEKRKHQPVSPTTLPPANNYSEFEEARKKYREELLDQISHTKNRRAQERQQEIEIERRRLEEIEAEKQRMLSELVRESAIQRENYKYALLQQANHKRSLREQEEFDKQLEKIHLDEQVKRFNDEQQRFVLMMKRGVACEEHSEQCSSCSGCNRMLPNGSLTKFP